MKTKTYCVIMAGGIGSRFWPLSIRSKPKQFIDILGVGRSLLQQTYDRFSVLCPNENIFIVSNTEYKQLIEEQLPSIPHENILLEPMRRNTAPCIAYANAKIANLDASARIIVTPADHLILDVPKFQTVIRECVQFSSENEALVTIGIQPTRIETGYGYIQEEFSPNAEKEGIAKVKTFTEKPHYELARTFFESGEFYWNSGIFIWTLDNINQAFKKFLPDIQTLFNTFKLHFGKKTESGMLQRTYEKCQSISIDYGIMEQAENVFVYKTEFGWSDLGTWSALHDNSGKNKDQNVLNSDRILTYHTTNSIINAPKEKLVVAEGLDEYIIVDSDKVLMIYRRSNEQGIKQIVTDVKLKYGDEYI